jgi:hypothetical protein
MPASVSNRIVSRRCFSASSCRGIGILLFSLLVYLAPAASVSAARALETHTQGAATLQQGRIAQYHGTRSGQYHRRAVGSRRMSAWNLGSSRLGVELTAPIAARVISPFFVFRSAISSASAYNLLVSRSNERIAVWNGRPIGNRIGRWVCPRKTCSPELETLARADRYQRSAPSSRDPRLMLQLGGILGLVYLAFLAVWIWATRFRIRPPRSART